MDTKKLKKTIAIEILVFMGWMVITIILQHISVGSLPLDKVFALYLERTKHVGEDYFQHMWHFRIMLVTFWFITHNVVTYSIYAGIRITIWAIRTLKRKN